MPAQWSTDRWIPVGTNSAGDRMYSRGGGNQSTAVLDADYESMTKAELQELLEARGLPKTGNKDELIERLTS